MLMISVTCYIVLIITYVTITFCLIFIRYIELLRYLCDGDKGNMQNM